MRQVFAIGALRLDADGRVLTHGGAPVTLGARGVAVLAALVRRAGEHVPKADIMDAAWPGLVVEEANLAVQISAIRRALACVPGGEGWIETLARRGYRFVGPVAAMAGGAPAAPLLSDRTRTNLPQVLASFIGREREIAQIKLLLPTTRLLTLTGTGGIGKTRLALQAAAEVLDAYRDGVWFVDLAPLRDPALVPSALAQVLGVKESAGQPLLATVCAHLRGKELLLILDNCEHVLGASADLVDTLLRDTAHVSVVATSRESLRVAAERTYPLGALPLPAPKADAASIARSDAVQLFVDRARQYRPSFDLQEQRAGAVAAICVRLDGIPLALELAAARVAVLPVEQIVRLLDQRFRLLVSGNRDLPRQQTLRAMIDWSHELLDDAEKALFARLSVFAGGWTVAAAEVVGAGEGIARDDVVYLMIALIEKSLVVADENGDRYRMLETVREYARERLTESGSAEVVRERHRDYFLALAEEAEPKLTGTEQVEWLQRLETEHENLRAGMDWSLLAASPAGGLRLCGALQRFWITRGHFSEARERCARALAKDDGGERSPGRAKALSVAGVLAYSQADYPAARAYHEESLAIARDLGDQRRTADALNNLGNVALDHGDFASAQVLHQESLAIRRELGIPRIIASSLHNLGVVAHEQGDYASAQTLYEESLAIVEGLGDRAGIASTLGALGNVALDQGDYPAARTRHEASLAIMRELDDRRGIARSLHNLGIVAHDQGDHAAALALSREALQTRHALGDRRGIASSLEWLATVVATLGNSLIAIRLASAAEQLRAEIGAPLPLNAQPVRDEFRAVVRAAIGDDAAFDRAWQEGRVMRLEQAIELALQDTPRQT
ncbi:MAG: tetratricopeptide repeat protein [Casimicrobiaceae bacterium]